MKTILQVKNLTKHFITDNTINIAVDNISFNLYQGECLGIVGESGCGKTTTAKLLTKLINSDAGDIFFQQKNITKASKKDLINVYKKMQMIFQSPQSSFNPKQKLGNSIIEILQNNGINKHLAQKKMLELLKLVQLPTEIANYYPHQASGGQCQRIAIARAISINPQILICDEITSALDVTTQKQIITLLKEFQTKFNLSIILITHDLALVQKMCNRVIVMYRGKIIEDGTTFDIINKPCQKYTQQLIRSSL